MAALPPLPLHHFTREEFDAICASGALDASGRLELLNGEIVKVTGPKPEHVAMARAIMLWFVPRIDLVRMQDPLAATWDSEPQPDIALVEHDDPHSHPEQAMLTVEVVVTTRPEAIRKTEIYAECGVPEYWIVDVPRREVVVHTKPSPTGYGETQHRSGDELLTPPAGLPPRTVAELFAAAKL